MGWRGASTFPPPPPHPAPPSSAQPNPHAHVAAAVRVVCVCGGHHPLPWCPLGAWCSLVGDNARLGAQFVVSQSWAHWPRSRPKQKPVLWAHWLCRGLDPSFVGLVLTCCCSVMASMFVQCLTHTPVLAQFLESGRHAAQCRNPGECITCVFRKHLERTAGRCVCACARVLARVAPP